MTLAVITCKAAIPVLFLITGQMNCIDRKAEPEPQKIVCSFARAPRLTAEEKAATPRALRRYVLKNEGKLDTNNCPKVAR
jgi:hypothetical protein